MKRALGRLAASGFTFAVLSLSILPASAGNLYIPLGSADQVIVIDTDRDAVIRKIEGLPAVHGLAGTPDGRFLIAGSYQERVSGTEMPAKPSSVSEEEHAAHHGVAGTVGRDTQAAVSAVSVIRTADGSVLRRIDVPGAVHHVAVSPDGAVAVVTHPNEGAISVISLDSYEVIATVETGPLPNYAAFSPDGRRLYVSNAGNATVSALDTESWQVRWSAATGVSPEHIVLSSDGTTLYVNNVEDGTVSVVAVNDRRTEKTIAVGETLHGIDLSDDGGTLFVADLGADKLVAVDLATGASRSSRVAPAPYHLAAARGAGKLYVSSADDPKIWVVDQESLSVLGEIPIGGRGHQMVQGPDA